MKWEVKKIKTGRDKGKWGIYLCKKYWKYPDKPVCYGASHTQESAKATVKRMNNPDYWHEADKDA